MKYKNVLLIFIAILLFIYTGFITLFPSILTKSFNIEDFEKKIFDSTSLVTTIESVNFKISPTLLMTITIANWSSKYIDMQDCFDAQAIVIKTNAFDIFTKKFNINSLYLKNVKFSNQTLADGTNKLAFLPTVFNSELFGAKNITIVPGPVTIRVYKQKNIGPTTYEEKNEKEIIYSKQDVKAFLSNYKFSTVTIK